MHGMEILGFRADEALLVQPMCDMFVRCVKLALPAGAATSHVNATCASI